MPGYLEVAMEPFVEVPVVEMGNAKKVPCYLFTVRGNINLLN